MQNINRIELKRGVNVITIASDDLGIMSAKRPIALLPKGAQIKSALFNTDQRMRSTTIGNQENEDACIKFYNMLGTNYDSKHIIDWTSDTADIIGDSSANTGAYFDDPIYAKNNTEIILETWISPKVWTMESDMLQPMRYNGCFGTQEAAVCAAGYGGPGYQYCEAWNGSSWSVTGSINSSDMRGPGSCGIEPAGLTWSGYSYNSWCEEYDGSSWSVVGSLNSGRRYPGGTGTQTAGISVAGNTAAETGGSNDTEEYNGSTWSIGGDLSIGTFTSTAAGIQNSALKFGGRDSNYSYTTTESYDGTSWQIEDDMIIANCTNGRAGASSSNALCMGGEGIYQRYENFETQEFNGSWFIGNNVNVQCFSNGCGTTERALKYGGNKNTNTGIKTTESFSGININEIAINGKMKLTLLVT